VADNDRTPQSEGSFWTRAPAKPLHNLYFGMAMLVFGSIVLPLLFDETPQTGFMPGLGILAFVAYQLREADKP
jgi:hypothetical protein